MAWLATTSAIRVCQLALLAIGVLFSGLSKAQNISPGQIHGYVETATNLSFPAALGKLTLRRVTEYEKQQKGLGISLRYQSERFEWADVYVYTLGLSGIPDGIYDPSGAVNDTIKSAIVQAVHDLKQAERRGMYSDVRVARTAGAIGAPGSDPRSQYLVIAMSYHNSSLPRPDEAGDQRVVSSLAVFGYKGHFVKVRYSEKADPLQFMNSDGFPAFMVALQGILE